MKKAEVKATGSVSLILYVTPIAEIQSKVDVAISEYKAAENKAAEVKNLYQKFFGEYMNITGVLAAHKAALRKTEADYKRRIRVSTLERLFNTMLELKEKIQDITDKQAFLSKICRALGREHDWCLAAENEAKKAVRATAIAEGFKYVVNINERKSFAGAIKGTKHFARTMEEAISLIYRNADICGTWIIREIEGGIVDVGEELYPDDFTALIQKYDEKYIDAEITTAAGRKEFTPSTMKEEFDYIVTRAIHYFTLDDFVKPVEELKNFCKRAAHQDADLFETAKAELQEWVDIASKNGVEIDLDLDEIEESAEIAVNTDDKAEDDGSNDDDDEDFLATINTEISEEDDDDDELVDEPEALIFEVATQAEVDAAKANGEKAVDPTEEKAEEYTVRYFLNVTAANGWQDSEKHEEKVSSHQAARALAKQAMTASNFEMAIIAPQDGFKSYHVYKAEEASEVTVANFTAEVESLVTKIENSKARGVHVTVKELEKELGKVRKEYQKKLVYTTLAMEQEDFNRLYENTVANVKAGREKAAVEEIKNSRDYKEAEKFINEHDLAAIARKLEKHSDIKGVEFVVTALKRLNTALEENNYAGIAEYGCQLIDWLEPLEEQITGNENVEVEEYAVTAEAETVYTVRRMGKYGDSSSFTYETLESAETAFENECLDGSFVYVELLKGYDVIHRWEKGIETPPTTIGNKNILPAEQEPIQAVATLYNSASANDIAKVYFMTQGKRFFKDDAKTLSYFVTSVQIKALAVLGAQVEEKIQEALTQSDHYYNIYDAECIMEADCRCLASVKRSFIKKAKHHDTLSKKAWKEHQKYFLEVFCGAAQYDYLEKTALYLCDTLGELEKSPSIETVTIDIQADEISNEIAQAKVDSAKGNLPTAEEYFDANDISSWKFGAIRNG